MLTRKDILEALDCLTDEIVPRKPRTEILMVGGGALVLLYNIRSSTKDLDVLIISTEQKAEVLRAAKRVAEALSLPEDWLNEAAKGWIHHVASGKVVYKSSSLIVRASTPEQLLAMKLMALRDDQDIKDAKFLLPIVKGSRGTRNQVWDKIVTYVIPSRETKVSYALDDLWEQLYGTR